MAGVLRFLKTTLLGGVLVLLPLVACGIAVAAIARVVLDVLGPVASRLLPFGLAQSRAFAYALAVLLLLGVCFLFGLLVRTRLGRAVGRWFEGVLLNRLPGYRAMRRLASQVAGAREETFGEPVWVRLDDSRRLGFLVEAHPSGEVAVFLPFSPVLTVGTVVLVDGARVERIGAPFLKATQCLSEMGVGSAALRPGGAKP
jgi:uncharacterized membrane protein